MRIGLLQCGHVDPRSTHIAGDYPELFAELLGESPIELVRYHVAEGQLPDRPSECDGWLCSPSRSSVYDDEPWIRDAEEFHRRIVASEAPYVGICFGHQLLAQALGGRVERAAGGWNVGVNEYTVHRVLPFMETTDAMFRLLASHQDQVVELPDGAELFASATDGSCPIGGFTVGERAWTIQLHPEFVAPLADHLLGLRVDLIGRRRVERARETLQRPIDRARVAGWITRFFATHC